MPGTTMLIQGGVHFLPVDLDSVADLGGQSWSIRVEQDDGS